MTVDKENRRRKKKVFDIFSGTMLIKFFPFIVLSPGPGVPNHWTFCPYVTHLINIISSREARAEETFTGCDR